MQCPECKNELPEKAKFCLECGASVSRVSAVSGMESGEVSVGPLRTMMGAAKPADNGGDSLDGMRTMQGGSQASDDAAGDRSLGDYKTMQGAGDGKRSTTDSAGTPLSDRYELGEELGRGGFARVWKAVDKKLGRTVAVKRLLADQLHGASGEQTISRFRREAQAIAQLNHINIAGVYDHDRDDEGDYIVMECVEGGTLRDYLKANGGKLPLEEALELARGIARGLAYAHRKNLVHRDIKPANVLLYRDGENIVPKIVDFGLARMGSDSELSMSGFGMGTPWYMPPEQRRNAKGVNHTADIYAVGKVLYELVSGDVPDNVDPDMVPEKWLVPVILKCIKTNPEERYFSCEDLIKDLAGKDSSAIADKPESTGAVANTCPSCGTHNPADVKFCRSCGTGLCRSCPECEHEDLLGVRFCGGCGTDIDGFLSLQNIVSKMEQYSSAKKSSRVLKEADLADQLKFTAVGKRGQELLQKVAGLKRRAGEQEQRKKELLDLISGNWTDGQRADDVETAIREYESLVESLPEEMQAIRSRVPVLGRLTRLADSLDQIKQSVEAGSWREAEAALTRLDIKASMEHPDDQQAYEAILQRHQTLSEQVAALRQQEIADLRGSIAESEEEGDWDAVKSCAGKLLELCPDEHDVSEVAQRAELEQNRINFVSAALDAFDAAKYKQCLAACAEAMNLAGGDVKIESESFSGPISKLRDMAEKKLNQKANVAQRRKRNVLVAITACIVIGIAGLLAKEGYVRHAYRARVSGFEQAVRNGDQQAANALSAWLIAQSGDGWRRAYPAAVAYRDAVAEMTDVQNLMQLSRKLSSNKAHPDVWREIEQGEKAALDKLSSLDFAGAITAYQGIARQLKPIVQYGTVQVDVEVPEYARSFYNEATKRVQIGDEAWQTVPAFPIKRENLLAKSHEVRIQVSGFRAEPSTAFATVRDGQTETVRFTLTPEPALVTVQANVPGAEVFDASGARLGAVGSPIEFPSRRELTITLRAVGFVDKTEQIEALDSGKTYTYSFILKEVPIPKVGRNWVSPSTEMDFVWIEALKIWVGKYEVTNGEYRQMWPGKYSKSFDLTHYQNGDRQPVVQVNFDNAKDYAAWLTERDKAQLGGMRYRLPSEQEFMTYAQCGDGREYPWGNNWPPHSGQAGNYRDITAGRSFPGRIIEGYDDGSAVTCDVEMSWANPWGLYGVGGNVWEICASDSSGSSFGARRGASYRDNSGLRCAYRSEYDVRFSASNHGFRLVLSR